MGEQFADVNVVDRVALGGSGVMEWAGICYGHNLTIFSPIRGRNYIIFVRYPLITLYGPENLTKKDDPVRSTKLKLDLRD